MNTLAHHWLGASLVDAEHRIWLPFDVALHPELIPGLQPLPHSPYVRHADKTPFELPPHLTSLHVINATGVALGDAIMGLTALIGLKRLYPALKIVVYYGRYAPDAVKSLLRLVSHWFEVVELPARLPALGPRHWVIDLADVVARPSFGRLHMLDFFIQSLGVPAALIPRINRQHHWLQDLSLPSVAPAEPYVFFSPRASTRLRTMPEHVQYLVLDALWQQYRLPVYGFEALTHPAYHHLAPVPTRDYLAWVRSARFVFSTDSATLHVAAGFDVPTVAVFVSIDPVLRVKDYPQCFAMDIRHPGLYGLHRTDEASLLEVAQRQWETHWLSRVPWPALKGA
ncbi:hypothetical protein [Leeia oryzae]|uniref:hypothetical protein n=1 Tax=Leeia oryzae TaxID=356662 RepID=UPI000372B8F1|nr:hypothetical protein [Leeia oryzae]